MTPDDNLRITRAALLWLLNHYENGTHGAYQIRGKVVARIEEVLRQTGEGVSIADLIAFRQSVKPQGKNPKEEEDS